MSNKDNKFKISNELKKASIGVFICLIAIYLCLNLVRVSQYDIFIYPARAINWIISFLFGGIFSFVLYIILFCYGLSLILYKRKEKPKYKLLLIGAILFSIGGMILLANSFSYFDQTNYLTFNNFGTFFNENILATEDYLIVDITKNCGIIGAFLVACINSLMTYIGSYVIGSIIFVAGIIILLIKPIIFCVNKIKEYRNFNYKYSPNTDFTKSKDLTVTTTTMVSLEDSDTVNISTKKIKNETKNVNFGKEESEEELSKEFLNKLEKESTTYYENIELNSRSNNHDYFNNAPLKRAKYQENDDKYDFESVNQIRNNSLSKEANLNVKQNDVINNRTQDTNNSLPKTKDYSNTYAANKPKFDYLNELDENKVVNQKPKKKIRYMSPATSLLETRQTVESDNKNREIADERSEIINEALNDLNIKARVVSYKIGPSVTRFDIQTDRNNSIKGFNLYLNDICQRLGGVAARFSPIVLGKTTSGLEIANATCSMVNFKDCIQTLNKLKNAKSTNIPLGKDINNELLTVDLQDTPHLLVAGTTGSGKSIFVHSLIMSLIMRNSPDNLKLILIDPKTVELSRYREIPHLLCPPIDTSDPQKPYDVLIQVCEIMERRYRAFSEVDCSKLKEYNEYCVANNKPTLPIIVIVVDEYADLIEVNKRFSEPVVRLCQKARAAGIHLIVATQRPTVNVINGVIKANIPSRIALLTTSATDSMTIIDQGGAEKLIGNGDLLIKCPLISNTQVIRCQGPYISNAEIKAVCDYLRNNYEPDYDSEIMDILTKPILEENEPVQTSKESRFGSDEDIYIEVKNWAMSEEYISMSRIQTTFSIGFNRASRIFKRLQKEGVVSDDPATNSSKGSKVLVHNYDDEKHDWKISDEQTTFKKN